MSARLSITARQAAALDRLLSAYLVTDENDPGRDDLALLKVKVERVPQDHTAYDPPAELATDVARLTQQEFKALPDYSASLPTGTTIGKQWKRRNDYYDESKGWRLGEYVEHPNPDLVGIRWRDIEIVAAHTPAVTS
jgi:hypothetical protein